MTIAFVTNIVSPHQLPLAREIVSIAGEGNYVYAYTEPFHAERARMGWGDGSSPSWCRPADECREFLQCADFVYSGKRDPELFRERAEKGKKTFYVSERWFKPILLPLGLKMPGVLKLLSPRYFKMARAVVRLMDGGNLVYLPQGVYAARDMARLCGLMHGDLGCLFKAPRLEFENMPGGRIALAGKNAKSARKYCLDKMRIWGYFVEPSKFAALPVQEAGKPTPQEIKVLWVGRLLNLKRVDAIVRAVGEHANLKRVDDSLPKITLDIYGLGPEKERLGKLAAKYGDAVKFHPPVPIVEVRRLMREHDVYVLSSNEFEGWGAVVSEALEEGMSVIGTYEAGASATILPEERLFHAGDWRALAVLLRKAASGGLKPTGIGGWTAETAAATMIQLAAI